MLGKSTPMPLLRRAKAAIATAIVGALAAGCGNAKPAVEPPKAPILDVIVVSGAQMNDGRPCYIVVRTVEESSFLEEPYSAIASKVFTHDPTVLKAEVIFPGKSKSLQIAKPESGGVAIYVLFTRPQGEWKQLLSGAWSQRLWLRLDGSTVPTPIRQ